MEGGGAPGRRVMLGTDHRVPIGGPRDGSVVHIVGEEGVRWQPHGGWGTHPLNRDGIALVNVFHFLSQRDRRNGHKACAVRVPDTVILDSNAIRVWFGYDEETRELRRKSHRECDSAGILKRFCGGAVGGDGAPEEKDMAAVHLFSGGVVDGDTEAIGAEFFLCKDLPGFLLHRDKKGCAVLQRFVLPRGRLNSALTAVWSPGYFQCAQLVSNAVLRSRAPPYERGVTWEGNIVWSDLCSCPKALQMRIKAYCEQVRDHLLSVDRLSLRRLVAHFKVDRENKLWLLWVNCCRVGPPQSVLLHARQAPTARRQGTDLLDGSRVKPLPVIPAPALVVAIDMDGLLIAGKQAVCVPGAGEAMHALCKAGCSVVLWTALPEAKARDAVVSMFLPPDAQMRVLHSFAAWYTTAGFDDSAVIPTPLFAAQDVAECGTPLRVVIFERTASASKVYRRNTIVVHREKGDDCFVAGAIAHCGTALARCVRQGSRVRVGAADMLRGCPGIAGVGLSRVGAALLPVLHARIACVLLGHAAAGVVAAAVRAAVCATDAYLARVGEDGVSHHVAAIDWQGMSAERLMAGASSRVLAGRSVEFKSYQDIIWLKPEVIRKHRRRERRRLRAAAQSKQQTLKAGLLLHQPLCRTDDPQEKSAVGHQPSPPPRPLLFEDPEADKEPLRLWRASDGNSSPSSSNANTPRRRSSASPVASPRALARRRSRRSISAVRAIRGGHLSPRPSMSDLGLGPSLHSQLLQLQYRATTHFRSDRCADGSSVLSGAPITFELAVGSRVEEESAARELADAFREAQFVRALDLPPPSSLLLIKDADEERGPERLLSAISFDVDDDDSVSRGHAHFSSSTLRYEMSPPQTTAHLHMFFRQLLRITAEQEQRPAAAASVGISPLSIVGVAQPTTRPVVRAALVSVVVSAASVLPALLPDPITNPRPRYLDWRLRGAVPAQRYVVPNGHCWAAGKLMDKYSTASRLEAHPCRGTAWVGPGKRAPRTEESSSDEEGVASA